MTHPLPTHDNNRNTSVDKSSSALPTTDKSTDPPSTTTTLDAIPPKNTLSLVPSATADSPIVNHVFGLFNSDPNIVAALRNTSLVHLKSILTAKPSTYLADGIIHKADEKEWQYFIRFATSKGWSNDAQVLSFTDKERDTKINKIMDAEYDAAAYAGYIASNDQNNVKHQVCHKNATLLVHTVDCTSPTSPTNDKHADSNNEGNDNEQTQDSDTDVEANSNNSDGTDTNGDDFQSNAYEHSYNARFDTGTAYATGYADGHADGQETMVVSDDDGDGYDLDDDYAPQGNY